MNDMISGLFKAIFALITVGGIVLLIHLFLNWLEEVIPKVYLWTLIPVTIFGGAFIFMITGNTDWNYFWTFVVVVTVVVGIVELVSRWKK